MARQFFVCHVVQPFALAALGVVRLGVVALRKLFQSFQRRFSHWVVTWHYRRV